MPTSRLEAFSDGVLAIIITIMVLELKIPHGEHLADLVDSTGVGLLTYLLSFVYVGIYWNNHHHMFQLARRASGGVLWANLGLLFCLSLFPFTTAWMDDSRFARTPVVLYGLDLLCAAVAYYLLQTLLIRQQGPDSALRKAIGADLKGKLSPVCYLAGMACALLLGGPGVWLAVGCFVFAAVIWIVPDRRIYRVARDHQPPD